MPTLHPHPEDLDDLEPMTLCDRCGDAVPVSDASAGLSHWHAWPDATLCPDCWEDTDIEEVDRMREDQLLQDFRTADERLVISIELAGQAPARASIDPVVVIPAPDQVTQ